ncbi:putative nuclease HARBI1 [Patiria miniata]|uniref:Putative nuclease HARBI1 n=1 Tax=Patiria miniata TaxID=46514 RepID=A0A913ZAP9_PATMI|nr:putative nuclease HARBI1 [Patiria miniata]XP_038047985.1 putative nuclease HARBI1 [Patiria miniata]
MQLLTALRFFATGSFYTMHGDLHDMSAPSVSRIIHRVCRAINREANRVIKFPVRQHDVNRAQRDFFAIAGFPEVVGAVDGSHIRLYGAPLMDDEHLYVNRKGWHSINIQVICDANYLITNVVARWPGSTHDSAIIHGSVIGDMFSDGRLQGMLIGDSAYALRPWLMTPIENPITDAERNYNRCHRRTRVKVEQTFGQLKRKFPCLALGLRVSPSRTCQIIKACCVLHNLAKIMGEPDFEEEVEVEEVGALPYVGVLHDGQAHRERIIRQYFN